MDSNTSMESTAASIKEMLLPGAVPSRTRMLDRTLRSLTPEQMEMVERAVKVAVSSASRNLICDAVESRDMLTLNATARWGKPVKLQPLESALNAEFSEADQTYDIYSPEYEAHIEAYVTYHDYCVTCTPHDRDLEFDDVEEPEHAHYVDYIQDYELMDAVQEHPERVTELVRLAAQRGGLNPDVLDDYLGAEHKTLADGVL